VSNDKVAATIHPNHRGGYDVTCEQCEDDQLFHSLFYDVAERFADTHADARGHDTDVVERKTSA
jgi:hypothetical protein